MIATRTLPSSTRALPLVDAIRSSEEQLLADVQDALDDRDPGRRSEEIDRRLEQHDADRGEHEPRGDHDDALGPRAEPDVAAEAERLRLRAGVGDEVRAGDGGHGRSERQLVVVAAE